MIITNSYNRVLENSNLYNSLQDNMMSESEGMEYMEKAAKHGNLTAILQVAQSYH